jgi:hypothetical protein
MINFMYDFINRFANWKNDAYEESLDRCFGTPNWRSVRDSPDRESALVNLYVDQIRRAGRFPYATFSSVLKPLHDRPYFHLVYATRSAKGIEKFREVEKKVVSEQEVVRERAQRENREHRSGQAELEMVLGGSSRRLQEKREQRLREADARIVAILETGAIGYETLQPQVLELPLVWNSDLNDILVDGHKRGRFLIEGLRPRQRTPKAGCTIRLNKTKFSEESLDRPR